jgi:hypothetical protein
MSGVFPFEVIRYCPTLFLQTYNAICFACGKDDLGSWQALRKHQADGDHLAKTVPDRSLWDTEE